MSDHLTDPLPIETVWVEIPSPKGRLLAGSQIFRGYVSEIQSSLCQHSNLALQLKTWPRNYLIMGRGDIILSPGGQAVGQEGSHLFRTQLVDFPLGICGKRCGAPRSNLWSNPAQLFLRLFLCRHFFEKGLLPSPPNPASSIPAPS